MSDSIISDFEMFVLELVDGEYTISRIHDRLNPQFNKEGWVSDTEFVYKLPSGGELKVRPLSPDGIEIIKLYRQFNRL